MKQSLYILFLFIFSISFCYSNKHIKFKNNDIRLSFENELIEDFKSNNIYESNRKKLVEISLSALFPGLGHFYSKNYKIGAIYSAVDIIGWIGRENYISKSKKSSSIYKEFAQEHWSLSRWFKYYFNPIGNNADQIEDWFTHITQDGSEIEIPFKRPWEQAHDIRFYYNGSVVSTKQKDIYNEICNTDEFQDFVCNAELEEINSKVGNPVYSHHFFEGIGKYNLYFAGWDDSGEGYLETINGDIIYTDNKKYYENNLRANHKYNNNTASDFLSLLLINRAVSILDVILRKNNKNLSINTESNYDIDNRYRINSLKLSIDLN